MDIDSDVLQELADRALAEDIGTGDITTAATVSSDLSGTATIVAKSPGVISGIDIARVVFLRVDPDAHFSAVVKEGDSVEEGDQLAVIKGSLESLLAAERTALNFLMHLSGIATLTAQYVNAIKGSKCKILDTRKTPPGLRLLDKRAVVSGGGVNHRLGLYDMILIKENHIAAAGSITTAVSAAIDARDSAKQQKPLVEVETTNLKEVEAVLGLDVDRIMLDNFDVEATAEAVKLVRERKVKLEIEASGNINLDNVRQYAETGVDFVSIGAITHSAPWLDLSMRIEIKS
jgi:nicotinate-nucleotide pyrophosphorylase (carboxylating)